MLDLERARGALREEADETRVQRVWTEVARRRRLPRAPRGRVWSLVATLGAACVALFFGLTSTAHEELAHADVDAPTALRLADDTPMPTRLRGATTLSDTSRVIVDETARLDVLENDPRTLGLALRRGRARFEVTPGGPRTWSVDAGAVSVQVVGTVFEVARSREGVSVTVERGAVLVRGASVPDRVQRLEAGGTIFVPNERPTSPSAEVEVEAERAASPAPSPTWREELVRRRYDRAFDALGADGHARETRRARDVEALWELADVARFSGHPSEAVAPLRRLVEEHPDDARAALAAYTLGRIQLDALGAPEAAAESLGRSEALGLPAALRETAAAARVEALGRAGRIDDARAAARSYVARHPEGVRRARVERWFDSEIAP